MDCSLYIYNYFRGIMYVWMHFGKTKANHLCDCVFVLCNFFWIYNVFYSLPLLIVPNRQIVKIMHLVQRRCCTRVFCFQFGTQIWVEKMSQVPVGFQIYANCCVTSNVIILWSVTRGNFSCNLQYNLKRRCVASCKKQLPCQ